MLTIDTLNRNSVLSSLTDEQKKAIEEMSRNDENTVISTKIGELHGRYDVDIKAATGIDKNSGEKSYDYLKRVLTEIKGGDEKLEAVKKELETEKKKSSELEAKLKDGADEHVRKQLSDEKSRSEQLQKALEESNSKIATMKSDHDKEVRAMLADNEFEKVIGGLKFKQSVTENMKSVMIAAAKSEVRSRGEVEIQTLDDGTRKVVVRGKDGNILNNPSNNLNPYTLSELFAETCIKDIIDTGRKVPGGGTGPKSGSNGTDHGIDFSGVKTQVEADDLISEHLMKSGVTRFSPEFDEQFTKIRSEAEIGKLPIQ